MNDDASTAQVCFTIPSDAVLTNLSLVLQGVALQPSSGYAATDRLAVRSQRDQEPAPRQASASRGGTR